MTRDELVQNLKTELEKVLPDDTELDGDDLDVVESTVKEVLDNACDAIDESNDEAEDDE